MFATGMAFSFRRLLPALLLFAALLAGMIFSWNYPTYSSPIHTGARRKGRTSPPATASTRLNAQPAASRPTVTSFFSPLLDKMLRRHAELQRSMRRGERKMRAIVAFCAGKKICGGIGDRLFGVIALFVGALLTDRAFFVYHNIPVPLTDFVIPNALD